MASDKDTKLNKKEQEIMKILNETGCVQVNDVKTLEQMKLKLEKIYGPVDPKLI